MWNRKTFVLLTTLLSACGTGRDTAHDPPGRNTDGGSSGEETAPSAERGALRFDLAISSWFQPLRLDLWLRPAGTGFVVSSPPVELTAIRTPDGKLVITPPAESLLWDQSYLGYVTATFGELILDARDDDGDGMADRGTLRFAGSSESFTDAGTHLPESFDASADGIPIEKPQLVVDPVAPVLLPLDTPRVVTTGPATVPHDVQLLADGVPVAGALEDPDVPRMEHRFVPAVSLAPGDWELRIPNLVDPAGREIAGGTQRFTVRSLPSAPDLRFDALPQDAYGGIALIETPDPRVMEGSGAWWFPTSGVAGFTFDSHEALQFRARAEGCWFRGSVVQVSVGSPVLRRHYDLELPLESSTDPGTGAPLMRIEIPLDDFGGETIDVQLAVEGHSSYDGFRVETCGAVLDAAP